MRMEHTYTDGAGRVYRVGNVGNPARLTEHERVVSVMLCRGSVVPGLAVLTQYLSEQQRVGWRVLDTEASHRPGGTELFVYMADRTYDMPPQQWWLPHVQNGHLVNLGDGVTPIVGDTEADPCHTADVMGGAVYCHKPLGHAGEHVVDNREAFTEAAGVELHSDGEAYELALQEIEQLRGVNDELHKRAADREAKRLEHLRELFGLVAELVESAFIPVLVKRDTTRYVKRAANEPMLAAVEVDAVERAQSYLMGAIEALRLTTFGSGAPGKGRDSGC